MKPGVSRQGSSIGSHEASLSGTNDLATGELFEGT